MKEFLKTTILVINICIIIFLPCVFFTLITSRSDVLSNVRSFDVRTGSMQPTLPIGTIVYTVPQKQYALDDIITFKRNIIFITHRIVAIKTIKNQTIYITKGDANNIADAEVVYKNAISGKVFLYIPYIGLFINYLKTLPGFILFIVLPSTFIVITEFNNIKREIEKEFMKKLAHRGAVEYETK